MLIKYLIGIAIFALIVFNVDFSQSLEILKNINCFYLFLNVPLFFISMYLASVKWHLLMKSLNFVELFKSNLISFYYTLFLPGQLASEGVKAYRLINKKNSASKVSCSVLIDKVVGIIALLVVGAVGAGLSSFGDRVLVLVYVFSGLALVFFLFIYFSPQCIKLSHYIISLVLRGTRLKDLKFLKTFLSKLDERIKKIEATFKEIVADHKSILLSICLGVIAQLINSLGQYFIAKSLGIELGFVEWLWIFAFMSIALLLPISFAGIGIRESSLAGIFTYLSLSVESAIAFSLASYILMIIYALIGYITDLSFGVESKSL